MKSDCHAGIYSVGRKNSHVPCDIAIPAGEDSVSRPHLEITVTDGGRFYVVDVGSANGTFVLRGGRWSSLTQDYVRADERIRLGDFETTVADLMARISNPKFPRKK